MARTFHLTIAKVGASLFDGEVVSVSVPAVEGVCEILAEHEPFVSELTPGRIRFTPAGGEPQQFELEKHGVVEVSHNQATILL